MNNTREKACAGPERTKKRFLNETEAKIAVAYKPNSRLNAYKCPYCDAWHIGNTNYNKTSSSSSNNI